MDSSLGINFIGQPHILPSDESTKNLDLFFANRHYDSCQATDELMKNIEKSQDDTLARKALALYQHHYSTLERPWDHVTFMYGLGLIYMHFNAYNWAAKSFREALYVQPSFDRSRDVHARLGLIFKATGRYKLSEKHFNLAINDTRLNVGSSTKLELKFNLAHLYEIQGKFKQAIDAYEKLLNETDLPHQLSANIHRQLGWLYFKHDDSLDQTSKNYHRRDNMFSQQIDTPSNGKIDIALNHLNTAYRTNSDSTTSYYIGRCLSNIGKQNDAFESYRSVIGKNESTADLWCSIGILYQRREQPMDALQAYIRSVQFDKKHSAAWMNLGILYESHNQFNDALKCYQHVLRTKQNEIDRTLLARVKCIKKYLAEIESSLSNNGKFRITSDKLLSLENAWNLESKIVSDINGTSNDRTSVNTSASKSMTSNIDTNPKSKFIEQGDGHLLKAITNSNDSDLMKHKSIDKQIINGSSLIMTNGNGELKIMAAEKNRSLLCNINNKSELDNKSGSLSIANTVQTSSPTGNHIGLLNDCKLEITTHGSQDLKPQSLDSKDFCLNQVLTNGASKDSGISSNSSTYADCALVPSQNPDFNPANHISAEQVIESFKNLPRPRKINVNLLNDEDKPPSNFPRAPPYPPLPQDKLFPSPPSIFLETKKDLTSKKLQELCQTNPISIVRNIASVLKLDLGLFSTKMLMDTNPDQRIEISTHPSYTTGENLDDQVKNIWSCECQSSYSTISSYAAYQVSSFKESMEEERESKSSGSKTNLSKESETDSNESASGQANKKQNGNLSNTTTTNTTSSTINNDTNNILNKSPALKKLKRDSPKSKFVRSASKIDLSDDKKWRAQLNELSKLPHFIKYVSASNMLTHLGCAIQDVNTVAMGMHVPGCRILGNKTPNNFCPININVGPGDYEWCAIPAEYARIFNRLCNKNGFEMDENNWWPRLSDLQRHNIPIYRFSQRPGDLVWVNPGTIYWVQSIGWCNNIHWNVGVLSARQYRLASESIELDKLTFTKPYVPMVQLTWNIVINIHLIPDEELNNSIIAVLRRSLHYCLHVKDLIDGSKQKIHFVSGEQGPKVASFCSLCESEAFNIHFFAKGEDRLYCIECARRLDPTLNEFVIKQGYELDYLMKIYDNFIETSRRYLFRKQASASLVAPSTTTVAAASAAIATTTLSPGATSMSATSVVPVTNPIATPTTPKITATNISSTTASTAAAATN